MFKKYKLSERVKTLAEDLKELDLAKILKNYDFTRTKKPPVLLKEEWIILSTEEQKEFIRYLKYMTQKQKEKEKDKIIEEEELPKKSKQEEEEDVKEFLEKTRLIEEESPEQTRKQQKINEKIQDQIIQKEEQLDLEDEEEEEEEVIDEPKQEIPKPINPPPQQDNEENQENEYKNIGQQMEQYEKWQRDNALEKHKLVKENLKVETAGHTDDYAEYLRLRISQLSSPMGPWSQPLPVSRTLTPKNFEHNFIDNLAKQRMHQLGGNIERSKKLVATSNTQVSTGIASKDPLFDVTTDPSVVHIPSTFFYFCLYSF